MAMDISTGTGKKKGRGKPEMNVTPLVDVVLVLLIIFMVIAPLMHEHFWVHVPDKPKDDPKAESVSADDLPPIVVTVNERGQIQINQDVYPDDVFPTRLRRMLVARGERKVYFDAHDQVPFERGMEVMDLARGGGAAHIAVMTSKLD
jgi:biopolymer transport protein ExbD